MIAAIGRVLGAAARAGVRAGGAAARFGRNAVGGLVRSGRRSAGPGRGTSYSSGFLEKANTAMWAFQSTRDIAKDIFGLPWQTRRVSVVAVGGPHTDIRRVHKYALGVAFAHTNFKLARYLPYSIAATWDVSAKSVLLQLEWTISGLANVAGHTPDASTSAATEAMRTILNGPESRIQGAAIPDWLKEKTRNTGIKPSDLPPDITGKAYTDTEFKLPDEGKWLTDVVDVRDGQPVGTVGPPIDGLRTSMLRLFTAAVTGPCDPLDTSTAALPKNQYLPKNGRIVPLSQSQDTPPVVP